MQTVYLSHAPNPECEEWLAPPPRQRPRLTEAPPSSACGYQVTGDYHPSEGCSVKENGILCRRILQLPRGIIISTYVWLARKNSVTWPPSLQISPWDIVSLCTQEGKKLVLVTSYPGSASFPHGHIFSRERASVLFLLEKLCSRIGCLWPRLSQEKLRQGCADIAHVRGCRLSSARVKRLVIFFLEKKLSTQSIGYNFSIYPNTKVFNYFFFWFFSFFLSLITCMTILNLSYYSP